MRCVCTAIYIGPHLLHANKQGGSPSPPPRKERRRESAARLGCRASTDLLKISFSAVIWISESGSRSKTSFRIRIQIRIRTKVSAPCGFGLKGVFSAHIEREICSYITRKGNEGKKGKQAIRNRGGLVSSEIAKTRLQQIRN
jgi:hypothetical protein